MLLGQVVGRIEASGRKNGATPRSPARREERNVPSPPRRPELHPATGETRRRVRGDAQPHGVWIAATAARSSRREAGPASCCSDRRPAPSGCPIRTAGIRCDRRTGSTPLRCCRRRAAERPELRRIGAAGRRRPHARACAASLPWSRKTRCCRREAERLSVPAQARPSDQHAVVLSTSRLRRGDARRTRPPSSGRSNHALAQEPLHAPCDGAAQLLRNGGADRPLDGGLVLRAPSRRSRHWSTDRPVLVARRALAGTSSRSASSPAAPVLPLTKAERSTRSAVLGGVRPCCRRSGEDSELRRSSRQQRSGVAPLVDHTWIPRSRSGTDGGARPSVRPALGRRSRRLSRAAVRWRSSNAPAGASPRHAARLAVAGCSSGRRAGDGTVFFLSGAGCASARFSLRSLLSGRHPARAHSTL